MEGRKFYYAYVILPFSVNSYISTYSFVCITLSCYALYCCNFFNIVNVLVLVSVGSNVFILLGLFLILPC